MSFTHGYKQTEVGKIPMNWDVVPISQIVTDFRGGAPLKPTDFTNNGVKVLPKGGVGKTGKLRILEKDMQYCSHQYASSHLSNQVDKDYIVVVLRDLVPSGPSIGLVVEIDSDELFVLAQGVYGFKVNPERAEARYLIQLSNTSWYRKLVNSIMVGSTQVHITNTAYKKAEIPLPPLSEQRAISTALSDVDALLEAQDKLIAKKRDIKQAAMQQLLTGKQRLPGFTGDWEDTCLGDLIDVLADYTANGSFESLKNNVKYYESRNFSVLVRTTDLDKPVFYPERFTDEKGYKFLSKTSLFGGEIVIANVGSIGKVFRVPFFDMPMTLAPNTYLLKFSTKISEDYIYQWMKTKEFFIKLISKIGSTTLQAINKDNLRSIDLRIPSNFEEQAAIATTLSDIDADLAALEQQRDKTRTLKQAMMQELLTGRIRLV